MRLEKFLSWLSYKWDSLRIGRIRTRWIIVIISLLFISYTAFYIGYYNKQLSSIQQEQNNEATSEENTTNSTNISTEGTTKETVEKEETTKKEEATVSSKFSQAEIWEKFASKLLDYFLTAMIGIAAYNYNFRNRMSAKMPKLEVVMATDSEIKSNPKYAMPNSDERFKLGEKETVKQETFIGEKIKENVKQFDESNKEVMKKELNKFLRDNSLKEREIFLYQKSLMAEPIPNPDKHINKHSFIQMFYISKGPDDYNRHPNIEIKQNSGIIIIRNGSDISINRIYPIRLDVKRKNKNTGDKLYINYKKDEYYYPITKGDTISFYISEIYSNPDDLLCKERIADMEVPNKNAIMYKKSTFTFEVVADTNERFRFQYVTTIKKNGSTPVYYIKPV